MDEHHAALDPRHRLLDDQGRQLLFEMATGRLPFAEGGLDVVAVILRDEPPFPRSLASPLKRVIQRCLTKEPARRYRTAEDVSDGLQTVAADVEPPIFGGLFDR